MHVNHKAGSILALFGMLLICTMLLSGCESKIVSESSAESSSAGSYTGSFGSEEKEIAQGLQELDDLEQIDQEIDDITLKELDNLSLE